jgi:topoisomerase IA-like protein
MTEECANQFRASFACSQTSEKPLGEWKGHTIHKKSGKFGEYLECGEIRIPYHGEEVEKVMEMLETKDSGATGILKEYKHFQIRNGPYGPYIIKLSLKKPQFISLPKGLCIDTLAEKDVEGLYQIGLEAKKHKKNIKPKK